jgi:hypothetical protein
MVTMSKAMGTAAIAAALAVTSAIVANALFEMHKPSGQKPRAKLLLDEHMGQIRRS